VPATHVAPIPFPSASAPGPVTTAYRAAVEEAATAATWLRRVRCGLTGHDMMLRFEPGRLSLRCHNCGQETPGWSVG
jgi:hypothetical protein